MAKVISTKRTEDGLRFAAKAPGSPFKSTAASRSCFLCGRHRQAADLKSKRVLGRTEMIWFNCRFNLRSNLPRLLRAACFTNPAPALSIRMAEVGR